VNYIINYKLKRVVISQIDLNSKVNHQSVDLLKSRGIKTDILDGREFEKEIFYTLGSYLTFIKKQRPRIILKWAQTPSGMLAPALGKSGFITNEYSRETVMRFRKLFKAVMVTPGTVKNDLPMLTARTAKENLSQLFNNQKNDSFLQRLLLSEENQYQEKNNSLFRFFLLPDFGAGFKETDFKNYIQKQKDLGGNYIFFTRSKLQKNILEKENTKSEYFSNFNDFNKIIDTLNNFDLLQVMIEAGPVFTEKLIKENIPDVLIVYTSSEKKEWENNGRGFDESIKLADGDKNPFKTYGFEILESLNLKDDKMIVYHKPKGELIGWYPPEAIGIFSK